jgi:hypothetical protein
LKKQFYLTIIVLHERALNGLNALNNLIAVFGLGQAHGYYIDVDYKSMICRRRRRNRKISKYIGVKCVIAIFLFY